MVQPAGNSSHCCWIGLPLFDLQEVLCVTVLFLAHALTPRPLHGKRQDAALPAKKALPRQYSQVIAGFMITCRGNVNTGSRAPSFIFVYRATGVPWHTGLLDPHSLCRRGDCVDWCTDLCTRCPSACPLQNSCICCSSRSSGDLRLAGGRALQHALFLVKAPQ